MHMCDYLEHEVPSMFSSQVKGRTDGSSMGKMVKEYERLRA